MEHPLSAGFSRVNMNPTEPIPLGGYGNEEHRFHESIGQDITVTAVTLTDAQNETILLFSIDLVNADTPLCQQIRQRVYKDTGIRHIYISAVHSHAAPSVRRTDMDCIRRYNAFVCDQCSRAAVEALQDQSPCSLFTGSIEAQGLNFVKHYKAFDPKTGKISVFGDLFGCSTGKTVLGHMTIADPTVHLVRMVRQTGKDIVLTNFRAHPHFDGGSKKHLLSSDYIGAFRVALEALEDCHAVYFQGACGNINATSRMEAEQRYHTAKSYGLALAATVSEGLTRHMVPCPTGLIQTAQFTVMAPIQDTSPELLEGARQVQELWKTTYDLARCNALGAQFGIRSPYHAGAIIARANRTAEDGKLLLNAVSIGSRLSFVTFPGEMFDTLNVRIEDNSPFATTLMLGYCNHNMSYLPSLQAYYYSCYETDITRFAPGSGEQVADACILHLNKLYKKSDP